MVEIAIALGVIGFAIVAIIGILPFGLEVQRDNRAETIITQDATFWMEAIRGGATGLDDITNWVEQIYTPESRAFNAPTESYTYRAGGLGDFQFTYGSNIISLLTTARRFENDRVDAIVTALSGAAAEKDYDPANREVAFRYRMSVEIVSYSTNAPSFEILNDPTQSHEMPTLHEVRLTLRYPYTGRGSEPRRKTFRSTISRDVVTNFAGGREYYLFAQ